MFHETWPIQGAASHPVTLCYSLCTQQENVYGQCSSEAPPVPTIIIFGICPSELTYLRYIGRLSMTNMPALGRGQYGYGGHVRIVDNSVPVSRLSSILPRQFDRTKIQILQDPHPEGKSASSLMVLQVVWLLCKYIFNY